MTPGNEDRDGPPPADDEGRRLLFGWSKDGEEPAKDEENPPQPPGSGPSAAPPATPPAAKDVADSEAPPDLAGTLASLVANQQRILTQLEDLTAESRKSRRDLADGTEWLNGSKVVTRALQGAAGEQVEGLKEVRADLAKVAAELKTEEEGIAGQLETFGKGMRVLDTHLKGLDRRSSELEALKQELAAYYGRWTAAFEPVLGKMTTLSKSLDAANHPVTRFEKQARSWTDTIADAIGRNAAEQRAAAKETSGNVSKLTEAGEEFLERFDAGSRQALVGFQREWKRMRRWTVPMLAAALVLAAPAFAIDGAEHEAQVFVASMGRFAEQILRLLVARHQLVEHRFGKSHHRPRSGSRWSCIPSRCKCMPRRSSYTANRTPPRHRRRRPARLSKATFLPSSPSPGVLATWRSRDPGPCPAPALSRRGVRS